MYQTRGWIFPEDALKDTPSIRKGMSQSVEEKNRREGCKIIMEVGPLLRLKAHPTLATAGLYFHRFYMSHAFQDIPKHWTALACLFLAGKVEETPKKCRDICRAGAEKFPMYFSGDQKVVQDEVMGLERLLLQTLKFDLQVDHPYKYLIEYVKKHNLSREVSSRFVQTAWAFVNDSISTTLALKWEPQVIAISMLHLAFTMSSAEPNGYKAKDDWWEEFVLNLSPAIVERICHAVLDFYAVSKSEKHDF